MATKCTANTNIKFFIYDFIEKITYLIFPLQNFIRILSPYSFLKAFNENQFLERMINVIKFCGFSLIYKEKTWNIVLLKEIFSKKSENWLSQVKKSDINEICLKN